ncbi:hypothetical protein JX266_008724 [Neoarthrinium moseri]|uniref:uncharacterized protein n=1 Tax=Neoarthrinium moseri TaxID=1658444 RepID=UPI001FDE89C1|nr:uncharacterized protein JN550_010168 [Neoarthrinium moseri]KAI1845177.1 hypothetical protein JX266_008724 [Neoarthrinium moseri]KAI1862643.1 hypothetical protein JN550_010168 [Neoarthrinium moseri]
MLSSVLLLAAAAAAYCVYNVVAGYSRNIAKAKQSGLPYYLSPVSPINQLALVLRAFWLPMWKLLPRKYWADTIELLNPDWNFNLLFEPFERLGDTFLVVSPGSIRLYTANAEAIHQITSKREVFQKPTESYRILALYGENVLTTEGSMWRSHRKVTSTSFNEKNTALVFKESINQTYGLIEQWLGPDGKGNRTIETAEGDIMALMLHIIGYVGFGLKLLWPGQTVPAEMDPKLAKYSSLQPPKGHSMNFKDSLHYTLHHILLLLILPRWLLRMLPFKSTRRAIKSENNLIQYMDQFLQDKIEDVEQGKPDPGMDIMGMLVRSSYGDRAPKDSAAAKRDSKLTKLMDSEIIGNAFIMIVAGHETTAGTFLFTLLQMAINAASQRSIQQDVDRIFGQTDPSTWDYEQSVNPLLASYIGACMNETLRTMPPAVDVPKKVLANRDQVLMIDGQKRIVPRGTKVGVNVVAAQHNPRYWPTERSKITDSESDLADFVPERWFSKTSSSDSSTDEDADSEDYGGFAGPDTSAQLFRPVRGSYLPFSDGPRSCLGRRIAQVEMIAALSVIFQKFSIELAVDEWASDAEVEKMGRDERREIYQKAQDKARRTLKSATSIITLKLHGNKFIPIRLVPRGQERFVDWVE